MPEFHSSQHRDFKTSAKRIILGSFPPYKFSRKSESEPVEEEIRSKNFYGNERNQLWIWYSQFVDPELKARDISQRNQSLNKFGIDVADVIYSCDRKGTSANDSDLSNRCYNLGFLNFEVNDTIRLLCTSKGVMNDMFFGRNFQKVYPDFFEDRTASEQLERTISDGETLSNPLARVFKNSGGKRIEAVALPSPGSPYRSLKNFGFRGGDAVGFLHDYLERSFGWFLMDW